MNRFTNYSQYTSQIDIKRLCFIHKNLEKTLSRKGKVLDVGCGNGNISRHLGYLGYEVLGVDISDKSIELARSLNNLPNVQFEVKSAEELKAGEARFDAIICSEVLEHLHDPGSLLDELYELLNDEGILIVTVPNGMGPREVFVTRPMQQIMNKEGFMKNFILKFKRMLGYQGTTIQSAADNLDHVQFFTRSRLEKLSKRKNFQIVQFGKTNFVEDVFPFSLLTRKIKFLQKVDCYIADILPHYFTGGFNTVWVKRPQKTPVTR